MEHWGRKLLFAFFGLLFGVRPKPLVLADAAGVADSACASPRPAPPVLRILVVRLDERLGNVILMTPVLLALRSLYPQAHIDVVVARRAVPILQNHDALRQVLSFDKRVLLGPTGILGTLLTLRRSRYDLAIDGANPTCPSLTHALMVRFCGAAHTLGYGHGLIGRLFTHPVPPPAQEESAPYEQHTINDQADVASRAAPSAAVVAPLYRHEIDMRLALLRPLGVRRRSRTMQVTRTMPLPPSSAVPGFLRALDGALFVLINVGARTAPKQLKAADYAVVANSVTMAGMVPVLSFGPQEATLAQDVANYSAQSVLAPPTGVAELAQLMRQALCVVSCDTGPMHLSVALGRPTCGLFISTDPERYGHDGGSNSVIDARGRDFSQWLPQLKIFLTKQRLCEVSRPKAPQLLPEEMTPLLVEGSQARRVSGVR